MSILTEFRDHPMTRTEKVCLVTLAVFLVCVVGFARYAWETRNDSTILEIRKGQVSLEKRIAALETELENKKWTTIWPVKAPAKEQGE